MRKLVVPVIFGLFLIASLSLVYGQDIVRKEVDVPKVDPTSMVIDGVMDETAWDDAAEANLVTATGFEIWYNPYGREMAEPDFDEYYSRMLWANETLYVFIHIDEFVDDTTGLFWLGRHTGDPWGHWGGDQLFVCLSNRFGESMNWDYDGNGWAAPDGPYHYLVLGEHVTLNDSLWVYHWDERAHDYKCLEDSAMYNAADYCRSAVTVDSAEGVWDIEMAIYNPGVAAQSAIAFNIGGSNGSQAAYDSSWDAYAYYCWQPSIADDPFTPAGDGDPGQHTLVQSDHWAKLNFLPGVDDVIVRKEVDVPNVDPASLVIDGVMDETAWDDAAEANLVTATGFEIWYNPYGREMAEPDFDEYYSRMLWADETLYVFIHIDEFVDDTTGLFWMGRHTGDPWGHWGGDQLFVCLSNRFAESMNWDYDGNGWAAPDGPYHYLVLGEHVTLNDSLWVYHWDDYAHEYDYVCPDVDSAMYSAAKYCRSAVVVDSAEGVWDIEMAIFSPMASYQGQIGFNIGGSNGSQAAYDSSWDAYAYYCWQPSIADDPFTPAGDGDPGQHTLVQSDHWAVLNCVGSATGIKPGDGSTVVPARFSLRQNYPNPFNPSTTIRFDVSEQAPVTLKVFDMLGREIATLVNDRVFTPGTYSVTWNATDFASGVYFYQLTANSHTDTRKMVLVK